MIMDGRGIRSQAIIIKKTIAVQKTIDEYYEKAEQTILYESY